MFLKRSLILLPVVFILMGNKGCETEEERRSGRHLKRSTTFLGISASRIKINDSVDIDLKGLLNRQFLEAANNSDYFISDDRLSPQSFSDKMSRFNRSQGQKYRPLRSNSQSSVCTKDLPDVVLTGSATDFEMATSGGLSIGFGGITGGVLNGVDINVKRMVMSLDMHAYEPLTYTHTGASVSNRGVKSDFDGGLELNLLGLIFNPKISVPDQFADVTKKTLRSTLNILGRRMESLEFEEALDPWSARVYAEKDTHILINAGRKHGLRIGDHLWISNMDYTWEDYNRPCDSKLRFQRKRQNIDKPLAIVRVDSIGLDSAEAKIVRSTDLVDIEEGAKAFVFKLEEDKKSK